uniref:Uncharacterized protein n=1 Tax=Megaselia scalaris TaxID=36166 RepID=T1H1Y4_MEGSC
MDEQSEICGLCSPIAAVALHPEAVNIKIHKNGELMNFDFLLTTLWSGVICGLVYQKSISYNIFGLLHDCDSSTSHRCYVKSIRSMAYVTGNMVCLVSLGSILSGSTFED